MDMRKIFPHVWGRLQDGDLVLFDGKGPFSRIIKWWTRGPYSHIGVLQWRNGEPYVIEARYRKGVIDVPVSEYLGANSDYHAIDFYRLCFRAAKTPVNKERGEAIAAAAAKYIGTEYDTKGILGFIRIATHQIFKFLPLHNPFEDPAKYWCAELVRVSGIDALQYDFYEGFPEKLEDPNSILQKYFDGTPRCKRIWEER
jgi:hypothetical protein